MKSQALGISNLYLDQFMKGSIMLFLEEVEQVFYRVKNFQEGNTKIK